MAARHDESADADIQDTETLPRDAVTTGEVTLDVGPPDGSRTSAPGPGVTTDSTHPSVTPQWSDMMGAPASYEVNPFDDIVVCMHPDAERAWRDVVPNASKVAMSCVVIRTPEGAWQRQPPDAKTAASWRDVFVDLNAKLQDISTTKARRVHLLVMAPFSLGALIGARLDPQNHDLVVYQHDNKADGTGKIWRPWGPKWPGDPGERAVPFFDPPPGLGQLRPTEEGDVAVVVNITGRGDPESCVRAVEALSSRRPVRALLVNARTKGQGAIGEPADADKAASELRQLLQNIAENLPRATLHLFYYGPLAILIRASAGLGFRRTPIIVHEAVYPAGKPPQWVPAIRFPEGRLLIDERGSGTTGNAQRDSLAGARGNEGEALAQDRQPVRVFVIHAKADAAFAKRLEKKPRDATWEVRHRGSVRPGEHEEEMLLRWLESADIAVAVVSDDLFSDPLADRLLKGAGIAARAKRLHLIPLLARECLYEQNLVLSGLKPVPDGNRWLGTGRNDKLWTEVDAAVRNIVNEVASGRSKGQS